MSSKPGIILPRIPNTPRTKPERTLFLGSASVFYVQVSSCARDLEPLARLTRNMV